MFSQWRILTLACLLVVLSIGTALAAPPDQPMMGHPNPGMMDGQKPMMASPPGQGMMAMSMMNDRHICPMIVMGMDQILKMAPQREYYLVGVEDLKSIYDSQTPGLLILDVRPQEMYNAGHIPGSLSIPLPQLLDKLSLIHPDTVVYVVCAIDSNEAFAVYTLRMLDYDAYLVPGGVPAWKDKGYPLTTETGQVQMQQMQHHH